MTVEDMKALNQLKPNLNRNQFDGILSRLKASRPEYDQRIKGMEKEDEFLLILLLLEASKSCTGIEEGVSQVFKTKTSDFLVELNNGLKMFIEVKSTKEKIFKISKKCITEKKDYAKSMGLELYFAINIRGFWMLFSSDYIVENNRKITIEDFFNSEFDDMFETKSYMFVNGLSIQSIYTKEDVPYNTIRCDYGNLMKWALAFGDNTILKGDASKDEFFELMALTALENHMKEVQNAKSDSGKQTLIIKVLKEPICIIPEYIFLLEPLLITQDENGEYFSPSSALIALKNGKEVPRMKSAHIMNVIKKIVNKDFMVSTLVGRNVYEISKSVVIGMESDIKKQC